MNKHSGTQMAESTQVRNIAVVVAGILSVRMQNTTTSCVTTRRKGLFAEVK